MSHGPDYEGWNYADTGWTYLITSDAGADYSDPNLDDTGWSTGQAPFSQNPGNRASVLHPGDFLYANTLFPANSILWARRRLKAGTRRIALRFDNFITVYRDGVEVPYIPSPLNFVADVDITGPCLVAFRVEDVGDATYFDTAAQFVYVPDEGFPLRQYPRTDGLRLSSQRRVYPTSRGILRGSLRQGPGAVP